MRPPRIPLAALALATLAGATTDGAPAGAAIAPLAAASATVAAGRAAWAVAAPRHVTSATVTAAGDGAWAVAAPRHVTSATVTAAGRDAWAVAAPRHVASASVTAAGGGAWAAAAPRHVYVHNVAPFAFNEDGAYRGLLYDMLTELGRRTGNAGAVNPVPLRRAQAMLQSEPGAMATLARFPKIEHDYRWLCKLADDKVLLLARTGSGVDISSAEAARNLRVGVLLGGPGEALARRLGFTRIETVSLSQNNARKLAAGRIDAWLTTWNIGRFEQLRTGGRLDALRSGAVLKTAEQYLAAPLGMDDRTAARWQAACAAMRQDGTHERIARRYGLANSVDHTDVAAVKQRRRQLPVAQTLKPPAQRAPLAVAAPGHVQDVGLARIDGLLLDQIATLQ
ncbi:ABC transporter substrate-binding protein [Duganella sp. SAP-35]|uniref:ABC transporter substrate-binding protein n=1 Tax=Duganella aceris TaxID=2703883 RepID=A0ABX0FRN7_9BURK|nr:ABC transporter substrate-binding protein [Duganella aceris]